MHNFSLCLLGSRLLAQTENCIKGWGKKVFKLQH
jgi:hypothetical protein